MHNKLNGLAGGKGEAVLYRKGVDIGQVKEFVFVRIDMVYYLKSVAQNVRYFV